MSLRDVGWIWEGHGLDPGVPPSIFGVGEGARYFGLKRACYMFHPNTSLAMEKMRHLEEIVCDITKWEFQQVEDDGRVAFRNGTAGDPALTLAEAENVSRLSRQYPNLTGAIIDDFKGVFRQPYTPERHAEVYAALKRHNPALRLWAVVYTHEFEPDYWRPYLPGIDVANLWVWKSEDLRDLDEHVRRCREIFPDKPLVLGCYLRDYTLRAPVALERLQWQFERVAEYVAQGAIQGFSLLAACLIDTSPAQAAWLRDFLAAQ